MTINFYKYQGTGNDFILIDNRNNSIAHNHTDLIKKLCNRKFGVGADGCILIENHAEYDFEMIYFNADGNIGSLCGNGGRCTIAFAKELGIIEDNCQFMAYDGLHKGQINNDKTVSLSMSDVNDIETGQNYYLLDTGSPHYISYVNNLDKLNVFEAGSAIRNNERFKKEGVNVNFIEEHANYISVRTFERGVENETLSCGTGVVAAAISYVIKKNLFNEQLIKINTSGGNLQVSLNRAQDNNFSNIWLQGPAKMVYRGNI